MDESLVQRALSRATGADVHAISGLCQEYACADRLARAPEAVDDTGLAWQQVRQQIEHCLRLYLLGTPLEAAKRLSGRAP